MDTVPSLLQMSFSALIKHFGERSVVERAVAAARKMRGSFWLDDGRGTEPPKALVPFLPLPVELKEQMLSQLRIGGALDDARLMLLADPGFGSVNLSSSRALTAHGLQGFGECCHQLQHVCLDWCFQLDDSHLQAMALSFSNLRSISLRGCRRIRGRGFTALCGAARRLETVDISECQGLGNDFVANLGPCLPSVRHLVATGSAIVSDPSHVGRLLQRFVSLESAELALPFGHDRAPREPGMGPDRHRDVLLYASELVDRAHWGSLERVRLEAPCGVMYGSRLLGSSPSGGLHAEARSGPESLQRPWQELLSVVQTVGSLAASPHRDGPPEVAPVASWPLESSPSVAGAVGPRARPSARAIRELEVACTHAADSCAPSTPSSAFFGIPWLSVPAPSPNGPRPWAGLEVLTVRVSASVSPLFVATAVDALPRLRGLTVALDGGNMALEATGYVGGAGDGAPPLFFRPSPLTCSPASACTLQRLHLTGAALDAGFAQSLAVCEALAATSLERCAGVTSHVVDALLGSEGPRRLRSLRIASCFGQAAPAGAELPSETSGPSPAEWHGLEAGEAQPLCLMPIDFKCTETMAMLASLKHVELEFQERS